MSINTRNIRTADLIPATITRADINDAVAQMIATLNQTGMAATKAGVTRDDMIRNGVTSRAAIEAAVVKAGEQSAAGGTVAQGSAYERVLATLVANLKA